VVTWVSVFDTVVLSLGALNTRRLEAAMPAKRLAGGLTTVFCFAAAASFKFSVVVVSLHLPATTAAFALLLPTKPVTSTSTSVFLFTPVSFSSIPVSTILAFEAAVDAVARVVAEAGGATSQHRFCARGDNSRRSCVGIFVILGRTCHSRRPPHWDGGHLPPSRRISDSRRML
ncbi:hypothetical protein BDZ97DRAFT_1792138, partial [Flammula alnicola]